VFSGVAGSAVGTVLFTYALKLGNPTVVQVVLNVQPLLSTTAAVLLFGDRLGRMFAPWAIVAVGAGMVLVGLVPGVPLSFNTGIVYALVCALAWGLSTVAGRAVMTELSTPLASGLRVLVGLACMTIIVAARGHLAAGSLWPAAADGHTVLWLLLLSTLSGGVPLLIYFKGLQLTRASTAGYFEMMQTLAGVAVTWGWFGASLERHQVIAAIVLIGAVAMVQRAQDTAPAETPKAQRAPKPVLPEARVVDTKSGDRPSTGH
jgi:drug/metabolite transporter (DMT)-like permease